MNEELPWSRLEVRTRRFLSRILRDDAEVDEAWSRTSMALLLSQRAGKTPSKLEGWVRRVAWSKACDLLRLRMKRRTEVVDNAAVEAADPIEARLELSDWLEAGIEQLAPRGRALLHLRYIVGLGDREIAEILGAPRGTIARQLKEARDTLHTHLLRLDPDRRRSTVALLVGASHPFGSHAPAASTAKLLGSFVMAHKALTALALFFALGLLLIAFIFPQGQEDAEHWKEERANAGPIDAGRTSNPDAPSHGGAIQTDRYGNNATIRARRIVGRVIDQTGAPLSGAKVYLGRLRMGGTIRPLDDWMRKAQLSRTDADGQFRFDPQHLGLHSLFVHADRHAVASIARVRPGEEHIVAVYPAPHIAGVIVDTRGQPIPGAEVRLVTKIVGSLINRKTVSDEQGRFALHAAISRSQDAASHYIVANGIGYAASHWPLAKNAPEAELGNLEIELARGASLRGRVTHEGHGVPNAEVAFWCLRENTTQAPSGRAHGQGPHFNLVGSSRIELKTRTQADGSYVIDGIPVAIAGINPTPFFNQPNGVMGGVVAVAPNLAPAAAPIKAPRSEGAELHVDLELQAAVKVEGRVVDLGGRPVPGIRVQTHDPGRGWFGSHTGFASGQAAPFGPWVVTDSKGHYRFDQFPARSAERGSSLLACGCTLPRGGWEKSGPQAMPTAIHGLVTMPDLVIPAHGIPVRVMDLNDQPVVGALVAVDHQPLWRNGNSWLATTDQDGRTLWWLGDASEGKEAWVLANTHGASLALAPLPQERGAEVLVRMDRSQRLDLTIVNEAGEPQSGVRVAVWDRDLSPTTSTHTTERRYLGLSTLLGNSNSAGRLSWRRLANRIYTAAILDERDVVLSKIDCIPGDAPHRLVVPKPAAAEARATLTLEIVGPTGAPVGDASISLRAPGKHNHTAISVRPGRYLLLDLESGNYYLTVSARSAGQTSCWIEIQNTDQHAQIQLQGHARLEGVVSLREGHAADSELTVYVLDPSDGALLSRSAVDKDGRYRLALLPRGPVLVGVLSSVSSKPTHLFQALSSSAWHEVRTQETSRMDLEVASTQEVRFELVPAAAYEGGRTRLHLQLESSSGYLLHDVRIDSWEAQGHTVSLRLPPDNYRVVPTLTGLGAASQPKPVHFTSPGRVAIPLPDLRSPQAR